MKVIQNGYAHAETIPLPCLHDDDGVLQYSSEFADRLIAESYGDDADKYEVNPRTLELFYRISDKMKFKVAEVTYESYFTDIKGTNADAAFREAWLEDLDATEPEDYELYSITIFHSTLTWIANDFISSYCCFYWRNAQTFHIRKR